MSKAQLLVSQLQFCKETSPKKWMARCPAHDDNSPSFSIKELDNGRVLIHCHAGCTPESIVDSLGLNLSDLYPDDLTRNYSSTIPRRERDVTDELVIDIARATLIQGERLSDADKQAVLAASVRRLRT
jgi:hypothetical protein